MLLDHPHSPSPLLHPHSQRPREKLSRAVSERGGCRGRLQGWLGEAVYSRISCLTFEPQGTLGTQEGAVLSVICRSVAGPRIAIAVGHYLDPRPMRPPAVKI